MANIDIESYPLHCACADNDEETVKYILDNALNMSENQLIYKEDIAHCWVPMHWAAHSGSVKCMKILYEHGVSTSYVSLRLHQTALHIAADACNHEAVKWLVTEASQTTPVNVKDYLGETALHKAARRGDYRSLDFLYQHGADFSLHNNTGLTAGQLANQCGHKEIASKMLLVANNAPSTMLPSNTTNQRKRSYNQSDNCAESAKRFRDNIQSFYFN